MLLATPADLLRAAALVEASIIILIRRSPARLLHNEIDCPSLAKCILRLN
jgi:hypothetical protein